MPGINANAAPFVPSWLKTQEAPNAQGAQGPPPFSGPPPAQHQGGGLRLGAQEWAPPEASHGEAPPPPQFLSSGGGGGGGGGQAFLGRGPGGYVPYQQRPPPPPPPAHSQHPPVTAAVNSGGQPMFYDTGRMIRPQDQPYFYDPAMAPPLPTVQVGRIGAAPVTSVRAALTQQHAIAPLTQPVHAQRQQPGGPPSYAQADSQYQYDQHQPLYDAASSPDALLPPTTTEEANILNTLHQLARPVLILVVGGRGSGKSTQSVAVAAKYGFLHLSSGDLVRQEQHPLEVLEEVLKYVTDEIAKEHISRAAATASAKGSRGASALSTPSKPAGRAAAGATADSSVEGTENDGQTGNPTGSPTTGGGHKWSKARRGIVLDRFMNNAEADPYYLLELIHRYDLQLDLTINLMMSYEASIARAEERDTAEQHVTTQASDADTNTTGMQGASIAVTPTAGNQSSPLLKPKKDQRRLLEHLTVWKSCNSVYQQYGGLACLDVEGLSIEEVEHQVHLRVDRTIIGIKAGASGSRRVPPEPPTQCPGLVMNVRYEQFHTARIDVHTPLGTPESKRSLFPGSMMTGLVSRDTVKIMQRFLKDYHVSWKADGTRLIVVRHLQYGFIAFTGKFTHFYFIDPKYVPPHWNDLPTGFEDFDDQSKIPANMTNATHIFDAELIQNHNGKYRIYLFDLLYAVRTPGSTEVMLGSKTFWQTRYDVLRHLCMNLQESNVWNMFVLKPFVPCGEIRSLVTQIPSYPTDGIVFQHKGLYKVPHDERIFKWKPQSQCSVDFRLSNGVDEGGRWLFFPMVLRIAGGTVDESGYKSTVVVVDSAVVEKEDLSDGAVVECLKTEKTLVYDGIEYEQWEYLRSRPDKAFPNYEYVARGIDEMKHMTQPEVVQFCEMVCGTGIYAQDGGAFQQHQSQGARGSRPPETSPKPAGGMSAATNTRGPLATHAEAAPPGSSAAWRGKASAAGPSSPNENAAPRSSPPPPGGNAWASRGGAGLDFRQASASSSQAQSSRGGGSRGDTEDRGGNRRGGSGGGGGGGARGGR
jgi:hypothetical protein